MLELKQVSKIYKTKSQEVHALDKVDLYLQETGLVFVTGKSGSGKTTLLNVIGGLDNFDEGEILIKDKSTKNFSKSDYDSYRNTYVGFVFQEYNLLDNMTIEKNISLATELQGQKDDPERVEKILAKVDLKDVASRKPQELSGGQRQRVAIARALVKNPSIIMADEPTGALDTENGLQIMAILKKLSKDKLVIVVSHDLELANKFADRIINMKDGKIESDTTIKIDKDNKRNILEKGNILSIKRGAKLEEKDIEKIKSAVRDGKEVHVTDNINVIKKQTQIEEKKQYGKTSSFIKTHLGFWDTIKLGLNTLKSKRVRLAITIILCAIAFAIFGIFDSLAIYDEGRLAVNTLKASISPSVTMTVQMREPDSPSNPYNLSFNNALATSISSQTGYDIKGVYKSYYIGNANENIPTQLRNNNGCIYGKYYYYKGVKGAVEFNQEELNKYGFSLYDGRLPESYDEVAISEYYANCMVNWWYMYKSGDESPVLNSIDEIIDEENPKVLELGPTGSKRTYKIVGIINTGKINKKFDKLKYDPDKTPNSDPFEQASTMEQNEFLDYISNSFNLYLFVKPGFAQDAIASYNTMNKFINSAFSYNFTAKESTSATPISSQRTTFFDFDEFKTLAANSTEENYKTYFFLENEKTQSEADKTNNKTSSEENETVNKKTSLEGNEILVDADQFSVLYKDLISTITTYAKNCVDNGRYTNLPEFTGYAEIQVAIDSLKTQRGDAKINSLKKIIAQLNVIQSKRDKNNPDILQRVLTVKKTDKNKYQPGTTLPVEYEMENNEYKIVGFYTGQFNSVDPASSFILSKDGIGNLGVNLMQGPYSAFLATNTGRGNINSLGNLLLRQDGIIYKCNNTALASITANSDFFSNLSLLFLIASAVFAVFSIVMFSNFISTSIKNKYGEIGILRALGARGVDILKMFVVEAVAIALINAVCACVIAGVGCIFVNMFLSTYLNLYIPLAAFGIRQVLIIIALSVLVGIISAIMPIWSVSKQKPVETIRRAF